MEGDNKQLLRVEWSVIVTRFEYGKDPEKNSMKGENLIIIGFLVTVDLTTPSNVDFLFS